MEIIYSQTGSIGNCSVIKGSQGEVLIIDCGLSMTSVNKETSYAAAKANHMLITHHHSDHTNKIRQFKTLIPHIHVNTQTAREVGDKIGGSHLRVFNYETQITTKDFIIRAFPLKHVSFNQFGYNYCECSGFIILDTKTKEKMVWATDTAYIPNKLPNVEFLCIECNYIQANSAIDRHVEKRRLISHMSLETFIDVLKTQDLSVLKEVRLLHTSTKLSEEDRQIMLDRTHEVIKGYNVKVVI